MAVLLRASQIQFSRAAAPIYTLTELLLDEVAAEPFAKLMHDGVPEPLPRHSVLSGN